IPGRRATETGLAKAFAAAVSPLRAVRTRAAPGAVDRRVAAGRNVRAGCPGPGVPAAVDYVAGATEVTVITLLR
ncbi:hypothetical protein, partial [Azospirillum isscasi]